MKIVVSEPIPLSADEAFHLMRDDMPALVPFLYDIDRIEVTDRREEGEIVHLVNHWYGDMSKVPGPVRRFASQDLFSWKDHAAWTTSTMTARWWLEPRIGAKAFECAGTTALVSVAGGSAKLTMDINLQIYPERVPGVPKLLARKFRGQIEGAIERQITPNMKRMAESIRKYAASR